MRRAPSAAPSECACNQEAGGADDPDLTQVLHNIAQLERKAGRLDVARARVLEALAIQERTLPPTTRTSSTRCTSGR